jgi:insertion element IS1 protein InsB
LTSNIPFLKKEDKRWIWRAVDHKSGNELDWQVGQRDKATFLKLFNRLESRFKPSFYLTEDFPVYKVVIPEQRHIEGKAGTFRVESVNSNRRHYSANSWH